METIYTVAVPEILSSKLTKEIERFTKFAGENNGWLSVQIGTSYYGYFSDNGGKYRLNMNDYTISISIPKIHNLQLIANVLHQDRLINYLTKSLTSKEVDTLLEKSGKGLNYTVCDHCGKKHANRASSFAFVDTKTNKITQIGSTCVELFESSLTQKKLNSICKIVEEVINLNALEPITYAKQTNINIDADLIKNSRVFSVKSIINACVVNNLRTFDYNTTTDLITKFAEANENETENTDIEKYIEKIATVEPDEYEANKYYINDYSPINVHKRDAWKIIALYVNYITEKMGATGEKLGEIGDKINVSFKIDLIKTGRGYYGEWRLISGTTAKGVKISTFAAIKETFATNQKIEVGETITAFAVIKGIKEVNGFLLTELYKFSKK